VKIRAFYRKELWEVFLSLKAKFGDDFTIHNFTAREDIITENYFKYKNKNFINSLKGAKVTKKTKRINKYYNFYKELRKILK